MNYGKMAGIPVIDFETVAKLTRQGDSFAFQLKRMRFTVTGGDWTAEEVKRLLGDSDVAYWRCRIIEDAPGVVFTTKANEGDWQ